MNVVDQTKSTQSESKARASRFVLTRRNQKGQMAIFVALIFQVIFVFFALLINVGLLIHHKINLQQSADLAAYYGAMKQAEVMNAMAHINFQIRQNWKLLTWRYRILGTFGFQGAGSGSQNFPFELLPGGGFQFRARTDGTINGLQCGDGLGVQDIPFFCVGHPGFSGWPGNESVCRVNCETFGEARKIDRIPKAGDAITPGGGNFSRAANAFIAQANLSNDTRCENLGKYGAITLARFMASYIYENRYRTKTIEMLAKNLSLPTNEIRDIEGELILDGVKTTFKNNLTEANLTGLNNDVDNKLATWTGLGSGDQCKFNDGFSGKEFLKRIEFDYINYFIHNCLSSTLGGAAGSWQYKPEPVYGDDQGMGPAFAGVPQEVKDIAATLLGGGGAGKQNLHTVGFEKNPYCVEYYAVKATTEPNIPFLPLKKIKLHATAVAKPFGGSIGPSYGQTWQPGAEQSAIIEDPEQNVRVDNTLPFRRINGAEGVNDIKRSVYYQPNFALFVGDRKGVRDNRYIAAYHAALAVRNIGGPTPVQSFTPNPNNSGKYENSPSGWPSLTEDWRGIDDPESNARPYDSLAGLDRGTRYLEISAIAPNQFDLTFYSIDPDFYNNYYKKLYKGFEKIRNTTGIGPDNRDQLRGDFGNRDIDPNLTTSQVADTKAFSVKDQILIKNIIFNESVPGGAPYGRYSEIFKFLASVQSSLLTGWTFLNFSDYETFPDRPVDTENNTMSFGQCNNAWNNTQSALSSNTSEDHFKNPTHEGLPPVAGNCVTGGRTGYSVKIVSPLVLKQGNGGAFLENPLPSSFLNF
ncbi:TadE/TadG family type IV pilus assembly protein [Pseudobdellovibrio exovorus]|uniref:Putative Flp pilus-assembly TadG-like N-terminal domain-containing protein n=1 Tax=Pseudobdellovibrio exovorus JSS TaxID=1184267 RepID=M4V4V4_9BACT|nr:Tad domain-containing protein [Pseudobdellovibrio exovorus]AGH94367.1 hypothetical protein A11Q_147 [Pseudobdellovibrio exovorus JSS]